MKACWYRHPEGPADASTVIVFLHHGTGDERSFGRIGLDRSFFARYAKRGQPAPRVLSVSFGRHWLLSGEPGKRQVVDLSRFAEALDDLTRGAKRRFVWGMSMGGYNAAVLALQRPGWDGAALSCPALYEIDPFEERSEPALTGLPGARPASVRDGRALFTTRLAGARTWKRENPLALAAAGKAVPMMIEANARDEFGFSAGARLLADTLAAAGARPVYRELPGGHCVIGAAAAADFFIEAPPAPKR